MRYAIASLLASLLVVPAALAQRTGTEQLLRPQVPGYVKAFENTEADGARLWEYVPTGQTVQQWTEMLTVTASRPGLQATPHEFLGFIERGWKGACPGGESRWIREGEENGYPFALLMLTCPNNPASGKPEYTWFKGIQGADRFYVVQKAYRFAPEREQVVSWVQYLSKVQLCDTQSAAHPCPQMSPAKP
ncbi:hypothetical protein [Stenotrophomonas pictorum]|uniref:hypothetical protein n=1 Tax=Stenotrophomonas pictorum TaxID=86184 RepID=UPI000B27D482|nr:hypothetical protein [Stenotrophomonas pictorum]